ncbi:MAG: phosphoenolpyruvate--protein phosphotransferase, partial [Gammaproteobacteria bacterium]|nr:phosphoenolpyruvate--protein phosphotransferase [Gammaproteobacteria bacterium]
MLSGIGVSHGIAIGKAHVLQRDQMEIPESSIPAQRVEDEVRRFMAALETAKRQLKDIRKRIPSTTRADITSFIDTHLLMLEDSALARAPVQIIREQLCNAEWALKLQRDTLVRVFEEMEDPYLRTRKDDVDHVVNRIQRILLNHDGPASEAGGARMRGYIVVADELAPADIVLMHHQGFAALVTEHGGPMSHTAILARSLHIPAIAGIHQARRYLKNDELLIIDGRQGTVLADPDARSLRHYRARRREEQRYYASLVKLKRQPAITRDGRPISLQANIELPDDIRAVKQVGASGIGLYRTEFLFMNRSDAPNEEEQLDAYQRVVKALKDAPVTIRTLDLGADKQVDGGRGEGSPTTNPALGLRAIRLCLREPALFRPQLRAILRASAHGPVRVMIPMLSSMPELFQVLALIHDVKRELRAQKLKFDENIPIGGMIEVPAAAVVADAFAAHLDFLSIGTNDLIQYTLAIDRINDQVNYLYDPLHPAVLQLIRTTIDAGRKADIPVAMCGEMAGDSRYTRLLLGLGLGEFSMHPSSLLEIKRIVNASDATRLARLCRTLLKAHHPERI